MSNYVKYGDHVYFRNNDTDSGHYQNPEMHTLTSFSGIAKPRNDQYELYFAINKY